MDLIFIENVAINKLAIQGQSYSCVKKQEVERWYDANGNEHNPIVKERYELEFTVPGNPSKALVDELIAWINSGTVGGETEISGAFCPESGNYVTFVARKPLVQIPIVNASGIDPIYGSFKLLFMGV